MGSPFKMNAKSPMMKALVGKQGNLPEHLQKAIKAAPESPAKSYGKKTNAPLKKKNPHQPGTEAYAKWEQKNGDKNVTFGKGGSALSPEKKKEYDDRRLKNKKKEAYNRRYSPGTGSFAGTYYDSVKAKRFRGNPPKFNG